ncbi:replication initiator protein A [Pandoraea apista]|uniref:replication initiator protein A n=1 Tax=Pandoraea apista TaxID=93218 RepID=UPI000657D5C4|nr:replication initiator protein A [Pandoraea apista]CFB60424.1 Replication initiator protein A [Pandoraea apista]
MSDTTKSSADYSRVSRLMEQRAEEARQRQGDLALFSEAERELVTVESPSPASPEDGKIEIATYRRRSKLLPIRNVERDFFLCDMLDYAMKDDAPSMEAPIFSLSTRPDLSTWRWSSKDNSRNIEVIPSVKGRATVFDKDVLIFLASQMTEALNTKRPDAKNRRVRFIVYEYLVATNRETGGSQYSQLESALDRLKGTMIKTDIKTGGKRQKKTFGLIESWEGVEKAPNDDRNVAIEVTLSDWYFEAIQNHEVLTIHRDYFRLRKPLERRLYELARKHCGHQSTWMINLPLLYEKTGSRASMREFRRMLKDIHSDSILPDYTFVLTPLDEVRFFRKSVRKLVTEGVKPAPRSGRDTRKLKKIASFT